MPAIIALFRGINVGGKNILPMKDLTRHLQSLGLDDVKTYIQSGNVTFRAPRKPAANLADRIGREIDRRHGFQPSVLLLTEKRWRQAIDENPFPDGESQPNTLHLFFLGGKPRKPDLAGLEKLKGKTERFHLADRVFYLHAPDGVGRSKLAPRVEQKLGVTATARNWRTVQRLLAMVSEA